MKGQGKGQPGPPPPRNEGRPYYGGGGWDSQRELNEHFLRKEQEREARENEAKLEEKMERAANSAVKKIFVGKQSKQRARPEYLVLCEVKPPAKEEMPGS